MGLTNKEKQTQVLVLEPEKVKVKQILEDKRGNLYLQDERGFLFKEDELGQFLLLSETEAKEVLPKLSRPMQVWAQSD